MRIPVFGIVSRYKEANRLRQVVNTFLSYGIETFVIPKTPLAKLKGIFLRRREPQEPAPVRFRKALESLGPTFIKLGQLLSTRADLLPEDWIKELMKLRDELPPEPWEKVEPVIVQELGEDWRKLFKEIDPTPIGSASIAQVYRGVLSSGEEVVVKVRRPGIEEIVELDLAVLVRIANLLHRHLEGVSFYNLPQLVDEFAFTIRREMDFRIEAANLERLRKLLMGDGIGVPQVYWDLTTKKVLVMEYIPGVKLEEWEGTFEERCELARRLGIAFVRQVLEGGIFHADPHPANVIVSEGRIHFVDFGMVGFLDKEMRDFAQHVFMGIVFRDYDAIVYWYKRMGLVDRIDERRFKLELMGLVEPYISQSLKRINIGEVVYRIIEISMRYGVRFPSEFLMLGRAMLIVDGTVKQLCSDVSVIEIVAPYAEKLVAKGYRLRDVKEGVEKFYMEAVQFKENVLVLSNLLTEAVLKGKEEGVRVKVLQDEIRDRELRKLGDRLVASTMSVGLMLAALFSWAFKVGWSGAYPVLPVICLLGSLALLVISFIL